MKISGEEMEKLIIQYGLKLGLQRDCSFLGHSIIGSTYVKDLKDFAGFGYGAVGALWWNGVWQSMTNNEQISKKVEMFIRTDSDNLRRARSKAMDLYKEKRGEFEVLENNLPHSALESIKQSVRIYRSYLVALGFYNAFMRFIGDRKPEDLGISAKLWLDIGNERNESASLYNEIEQFIKEQCPTAGKQIGVDGDLFRYLTFSEIASISEFNKPDESLLYEAKERQKHYFYLFTDENGLSEYIVSDQESLKKISERHFSTRRFGAIKGIVVFPGKVNGTVCILPPNVKSDEVTMRTGDVLVAVQTHPRYTELIKKASAIVTDEGGTLSHAAILSREFGIPCVIGTKIATKVLKDGDLVEVDAERGIVRILKA